MPDVFVSSRSFDTPSESTTHLFSSLCLSPTDVSFHTQETEERVLLFLRRHFITNLAWIAITALLSLLPLAVPLLLVALPFLSLSSALILVLLSFYYAVLFTFAFVYFITWYYNLGIVTTLRVVDIDFSDVVFHDVAQTKLVLIDDVNYTQVGFIRTLFNYGDVFVQTAGGKENIELLAVPNPARAVEVLANLIGKGGQGA